VLKLNVVPDEVDVIPAVYKLVEIRALDAYTFPNTSNVEVGVVVPIPIRLLADKKMFEVTAATPEEERYTT
jgi:hypothetical protein